jgi:hypothetical protein
MIGFRDESSGERCAGAGLSNRSGAGAVEFRRIRFGGCGGGSAPTSSFFQSCSSSGAASRTRSTQ